MEHLVYIHGLGGTSKIFNYLKPALPRHQATLIEYNSTRGLEESCSEILSSIPNKEISIIGHSLGGLLATLVCIRAPLKIKQLITIAAPFGGCQSASTSRWFFPGVTVLNDISPESSILSELRSVRFSKMTSIVATAGDVFTSKLPFLSDGRNDGVVSIRSQLASPGKIIKVDSNHFEVMQDPQTVKVLKSLIFN